MAIDLRSDTVTLPTARMREIIATAEVGDDVYGEDPSVNRLEELAARRMGKAAGLYLPTGTMANLCAHLAHTTPGQELVCGVLSHTYAAEAGGAARVAGLSIRAIPQSTAELDPVLVEAAIRPRDIHYAPTGLVWVEQPSRGYVMPQENLSRLSEIARQHNLPIHMDGARIFNAATHQRIQPLEIASHVDSIMFCVSKGLGAPVGSLLTGTDAFIERARVARKMLGGSMRQAGIIAAAGIYAIETSSARIQADHDNALRLANGLRKLRGVSVDRELVQTNIFFVDIDTPTLTTAQMVDALAKHDILVNRPHGASKTVRFVTHDGITSDDIDRTLAVIEKTLLEAERESDAAALSEANVA